MNKKHINAVNVTSLFSRNSNFTSHLKMHSGEKQNTLHIKKHITAVNMTSPFQEIVIDKSFENISMGKTNHSSQCDYPSSRNSNLTRHFKIHSGEKPNQCNVT